jgi:CelD/BcsL family acetyltransferase involved in cellulose biosynthesis
VVTVERISDSARLPALAEAWDELIDERSLGAVFRSSAWLLPWWHRFSDGKQLSVYAANDGTRLRGVLPAYHVRSPLGGQRLRLMGDGTVTSDYLGVIARPDELEAAAEAIARAVVADERDVLLDGVTATDSLTAALRRHGTSFSARMDACPYVPIGALPDFDAWIRDRPNGRRARRWLAKRPGFSIEILTGETEVASALPTLWQLHRARWAVEGGTKALTDPAVEQFHAESARALARRGWVRLYLLHAEGAPRAALYGFERGGRFLYYQMGSDPDWRKRSVGTVLLCAALEDAFERGLSEFDFLRGVERYKTLYTSFRRPILTLRAAAGVRARALFLGDRGRQLAEAAARTLLPDSARRRLGGAALRL